MEKKGFMQLLVNPYFLIFLLLLLLFLIGGKNLWLSIIGDDYQYFDSFDIPISGHLVEETKGWSSTCNCYMHDWISNDGYYFIPRTVHQYSPKIPFTINGKLRLDGAKTDYQVLEVTKDFKGMDVKIVGKAFSYSSGQIPGMSPANFVFPSDATSIDFITEVKTSKINPEIVYIYINGKFMGELDLQGKPLKFSFTTPKKTRIDLEEIKFKPQFNCELPEDWGYDIYVAEELQSISHLQIESETNQIIRRYCLSVPAIQIKLGVGVQGNAEILQKLAEGKVLTVPQGQRWLIFYITDFGKFNELEIAEIVASCSYQDAAYDTTLGKCVRPPPIPEPPIPSKDKPLYEDDIAGIREFTFNYNSENDESMNFGGAVFKPSNVCNNDWVSFAGSNYEFTPGLNSIYPFNIYYIKNTHTSTAGRVWCEKIYSFTFTNTDFLDINFNEINNERYINNLEYSNIVIKNNFVEMDGFILNNYKKELLFQEKIEKIPIKIGKGTNDYNFILDTVQLDNIIYNTRLGFVIETDKERFSLVTDPTIYTYKIIPKPPELIQCTTDNDCEIPCEGVTNKCIDNKCNWEGKCDIIIVKEKGILEKFWDWLIGLFK